MFRRLFAAGLAGAFSTLLSAQPAAAPGWTRITAGQNDNLLEPALLRTKDGVLHVIYRTSGSKRDLLHTALAGADGKLLTPSPVRIAGPWDSFSLPKVIAQADSLLAVFSGMAGSPTRDDPYNKGSLYAASSKDGGATWELLKGAQSSYPKAYASYLAVAPDKEAKPVVVMAEGGKVLAQAGLGAAQALEPARDGACCAYHVNAAADSESGEIWTVWHANSKGDEGLWVRAIKPALGAPALVPGSQVNYDGKLVGPGPSQQLALSARAGAAGVYLAYYTGYPSPTELKLWNVKGGEALTVLREGGRQVWLAPGPEGRLWFLWNANNHTVSAMRSNKALTRFSAPYPVGAPIAGANVFHVQGEGSAGPLDAFINADVGGADRNATFHRRIYPSLQIAGGPEGIAVSDLGDPVEGVELTVEGQTLKTGANGLAAYKLTPGKPTPVKAAHAAYAPAAATITLPKPPEPKARAGKK